MKRLLILFTNGFPYNTSEPYLETEYPLYSEYFDKVLIVAACRRNETVTRRIDCGNTEVIQDYTLSKDIRSMIEAIPFVLTDRLFYHELIHLIRAEGVTCKKLYDMLVFALCGNHRAMQARRWLRRHPEFQAAVAYAYWLHIPAYAALRLKRMLKGKLQTISRAHGYDLYLERHETGYIPFHLQMYKGLDAVASVSNQGKEYLLSRYGKTGRVCVHRLGAADRAQHNPYDSRDVLRLVSCARCVSLKRLDRIVDALTHMTDMPVEWTHIGDGPVQKELERYAEEKLPANVTAVFKGSMANEQVYEIYARRSFHAFVNVSETEGIPVAIMEAMSFDIPVIATDVGGTAELVDDANGYLLHKDFSPEELARSIKRIAELPECAYIQMRKAARMKFEQEYCAETNYRAFLKRL